MNAKFLWVLLLIVCSLGDNGWSAERLDPFSKITVKSESAFFKKMPTGAASFSLEYKENVRVYFADSTTVSADQLKVTVQNKTDIEQVNFTGNVLLRQPYRNLYADSIEIQIDEKLCTLRGKVRVEQLKNEQGELPISTVCEKAQIHWGSNEIELCGCDGLPVCTTIEIDGRLRFLNKKHAEKTS